ncbi:MAG: peptidoglycan-binding domain-containing protein [Pseudomonadota bacterium]|jgi:peptidoglycan hydrolase-like protein with peptidoglycan-binding domain
MKSILRMGDTGDDVRKLQDHLNRSRDAPKASLAVDGIFGPKTLARVKEFQSRFGLVTDGIVGPRTEETLIFAANDISAAEVEGIIVAWNTVRPLSHLRDERDAIVS